MFFFEKKNQKTSISCAARRILMDKVFLLLFLQKKKTAFLFSPRWFMNSSVRFEVASQ